MKPFSRERAIKILSVVLSIALVFTFVPTMMFAEDDGTFTKVKFPSWYTPLTEEEMQAYNDELIKNATVTNAPPEMTELGMERMLETQQEQGISAFSMNASTLPKAVDNSKTKYFPPIGNQGGIDSCLPFTRMYYMYTHNTALLRDTDVKSLGNKAIFSPKFTYDFYLNQRETNLFGAVTLDKYPYDGTITYKWPTKAEMYREAAKNKPSQLLSIGDKYTLSDNPDLIKQYLTNGYVVSGGLSFDVWNLGKTKDNPNSTLDNDSIGEVICVSTSMKSVNHAITIVGYNDDIWVDLNGDGIMQPEELGAWKIANSWGTSYFNKGFVWASYDSVKSNPVTQGSAGDSVVGPYDLYLPREKGYTPKLMAEVTLSTKDKSMDEFAFNLGWSRRNSSDVEYITGETSRNEFPLTSRWGGDEYSFDGSKNYSDATIAFDLTDYIDDNNLDLDKYTYDWYLKVYNYIENDNTTTIKSFKLTDADGNVLVEYGGNLPITLNGETREIKITYGGTNNEGWYITWNPNDGSSSTQTNVADMGSVAEPPAVQREGYILAGWYNNKGFNGQPVSFPIENVTDDMELYARWVRNSEGMYYVYDLDDKGAYIDLDSETLSLPNDYNVQAYSIDGGKRWKVGSVPISLTSLLNKQLQLKVTNEYNPKTKMPAPEAEIISFPIIQARPKANPNKLVINYGIAENAWTMSAKDGMVAITEGIQIATTSDGKTPIADDEGVSWKAIDDRGILVIPYGSQRQKYLMRTAPVVEEMMFVPASKVTKLSPLTQQKPLKVKADYKKEVIKLKADTIIFGGTLEELEAAQSITSAATFDVGSKYTVTASDSAGIPLSKVLDKTTQGNPKIVTIWQQATAKKPATAPVEYKLAIRAALTPTTIEAVNGRITLPTQYEVLDKSKSRWGALPKVSSTTTMPESIRIKSQARGTGIDDSGQLASSAPSDVTIVCENGKITQVVIGAIGEAEQQ